MKILILGSGAKEHAIASAFAKSKIIDGLFMAPGNPGTESIAINLGDVDPTNPNQVLETCKKYNIDYVFAGTEAPVQNGVVDFLLSNGIKTFGAPSYAIKLEDNRVFAKTFAKENGISVPDFWVANSIDEIKKLIKENPDSVLIAKPNYIAPSREIVSSKEPEKFFKQAEEFLAKGPVIIEKFLKGLPLTITTLMDRTSRFTLPVCSEYYKTETGNYTITGGMGAVCPIPLKDSQRDALRETIVMPTLSAMKKAGLDYVGAITFSIIWYEGKPYLVDYHIRLNDPATETMAPIIKNDLGEIFASMFEGKLSEHKLKTTDRYAVGVVVASDGYPDKPATGKVLNNLSGRALEGCSPDNTTVFFGAVSKDTDGKIVTSGGRTATVVALGDSIHAANEEAYRNLHLVDFEGAWSRPDIGAKFITQD